MRERTLSTVDGINIAALHALLQSLRRQVGQHNFVDALHHPVRDRLANLDAGDLLHRGADAFHVLHIHRGKHVDLRIQQAR